MKKVISCMLVIVLIFASFNTIDINAGITGNAGSLPAGGTANLKGGGIIETTCFRVGIEQQSVKTPIDYNKDCKKSMQDQIEDEYVDRFPDVNFSFIFVPRADYVLPRDTMLGWYVPGAGSLDYATDAHVTYKVRPQSNVTDEVTEHVYADKIKDKVKTLADYSKLAENDAWKKYLLDGDSNEAKSADALAAEDLWSYFFTNYTSTKAPIEFKLKEYVKPVDFRTASEAEVVNNKVNYLDLLMTLYSMSYDNQKRYYRDEINRYIRGNDQKANPTLITIDTCIKVTADEFGSSYLFLPTTYYLEYSAGITPGNRFFENSSKALGNNPTYNMDATGLGHSFQIMDNLINRSIQAQPDKPRITDINDISSNCFAWGITGVLGKARLYTQTDKAVWSPRSKYTGIMEALTFKGSHIGFLVIDSGAATAPPIDLSGSFSVKASDPEITPIKDREVIGDCPIISIKGILKKDEENKWNNVYDRIKDFQSGHPMIKVNLNVSGDDSELADTGDRLNANSKVTGNNKWVPVDKDWLLDFMKGKEEIDFTHNLMDFSIPYSSRKEFIYTADIQVLLDPDEKVITLTGEPASDNKVYVNGDEPDLSVSYTSGFRGWSELKSGSPGYEKFEAMAGTPTTEPLYFISGGSEFIVDFSATYKKNLEVERTYKSVFSGNVPSEFMKGDQAGEYTVPSPSGEKTCDLKVNVHGGDCTVSATWKGDIPNNAKAVSEKGTGRVSVTCSADPDWRKYRADEKLAQAWVKAVNSYTISHTAASDGKTRTFNKWNARMNPSTSPPTDTHDSDSNITHKDVPYIDEDGNKKTKSEPVYGPCEAKAEPSGPGHYTIKVTASIPPHCVCGGEHENIMPPVEDTWTQKITYDTFQIDKAQVWKIDRSNLDGTINLLETDDVTATIKKGDPNIFYNIAATETSKDGRLRYSLEPQMLDTVVWNEGPRTNKSNGKGTNYAANITAPQHNADWATGILYNNPSYSNTLDYHLNNSDSTDQDTVEFKKFEERRAMKNTATVISDYLILQTSSGDQAILYYEKESTEKKAQENFDKVVIPSQEMWENNPESAAKMEEDSINVGSYNGNFTNPNKKYKGSGDKHKTKTIFDSDPAKVVYRPSRPSSLMLYAGNLDVPDTKPNGEYTVGDSTLYYKHILNEKGKSLMYKDEYCSDYRTSGLVVDTTYSDNHTDINDIVIHNPVSSQDAMVMPVEDAMDQRTDSTSILGGNLQEDYIEYVTKLKEIHPKQEFLYNGNAEEVSNLVDIINWQKVSTGTGAVLKQLTNLSKIAGKGSFYIKPPDETTKLAKYSTTTIGSENRNYNFSGKIIVKDCIGYFEIKALNDDGKTLKIWTANSSGTSFTTPKNTVELEVNIIAKKQSGKSGYVIADDLSLTLKDGEKDEWYPLKYTIYQEFDVNNSDYVKPYTIDNPEYQPEQKIKNPNYVKPSYTYEYSGNYQEFTVPVTGTYTLEVWGAQGGGNYGGKGGYSKGNYYLTKGDTARVYVGGQGGKYSGTGYQTVPGGYNGGGSGYGDQRASGGGGATDIRIGGTTLINRVIVAGGGGGQGISSSTYSGGAGGGYAGQDGNRGGYGATQTYGYTKGLGGNGSSSVSSPDNGGGGGGWYGGYGGKDDEAGGGGGSGYIGSVANGYTDVGVREGNGYATITSPSQNEEPEYITIPAKGEPTITINNAHYVPAVVEERIGDAGQTEKVVVKPAKGIPWIQGLAPSLKSYTEVDKTKSQPPDDWYETVEVVIPANPTVPIPGMGNVTAGDFLTLDYPFTVHYPNEGDFYGDGCYGISRTTYNRGKGFVDNMDTTKWTKEKFVKFEFNVIYEGVLYRSGTEISLDVDEEFFEFYLPLANKEAISAGVEFYSVAINGNIVNNSYETNKKRDSNKKAKHSSFKGYNIDLLGRIGNMVIEDTGDFRFANLFKTPKYPTEWLIPNVVKDVDTSNQNQYVGSTYDIRGKLATRYTEYLNTFGTLNFLETKPLEFPLTPSMNNIPALVKQPLRIGYPIFMDIQTIGNYYSSLQVIPYYYKLDLGTGDITKVDVYMRDGDGYVPINIYGNATADWDPDSVYHQPIKLDWEDNKARRNYTSDERDITLEVQELMYNINESGDVVPIAIPTGNDYIYGIPQLLKLDGRNRTFIGTSMTQGIDRNPGDVLDEFEYEEQAQRWHFSLKLPSSSIFVETGKKPTQANIDSVMNNTSVIISALDIKCVGDTYVLNYKHQGGNGSVNIVGKDYSLTKIPQSVVAVFSASKSSADDLDTSGTH
ncbi:hypothetical protein SH1V18_10860 [Vallitalea longa]|uniref:receptor protein-tyrosine kinase n=1 Tax=Vallitalea longa TaxID=2936439 RepID=A0A9W6DDC8_9FIRM|nr:glycine rich domain-containing protein [Vallitalea longa]GKX28606.1 hypothetical protein SH1V18_10860 [Vallitalea longa]